MPGWCWFLVIVFGLPVILGVLVLAVIGFNFLWLLWDKFFK
jgi:hypothetical protein